MKRTTFYNLVGFILLTSFCSCSGEKKPVNGRTDTPTSGTIEFVSDESFSPIIEELRKQFEFKFPKAHLQPRYTNEIEGLQMIKDLKTCLFITSRGLLPSEIAYLKTKRQLPQVFPIGYDGLALIVNRANQDTCITVADVKRVLSGQAKDWADVVPGSKRGNIEVVFDNQSSATLHYVVDSILGGKPINSTNIVAAKTSKEVINYVDRTPNAIGVIGAYMLDGRYPFVRTLYAIVVDPQKGLPNSFANYIAGPTGQLIIFKSGLLPYRGDIMVKTVSTRRK